MKPWSPILPALIAATLMGSACVWGVVRDANTGRPIQGAGIRFDDSLKHRGTATTGENGAYVFDASHGDSVPAPGQVTFEVHAPGYETLTGQREVAVPTSIQDFTLSRCDVGDAVIELTHVPPCGSFERLEGRAICAVPSDFKVAVFIEVRGGWWTKPCWARPLTLINPDGSWSCDITTGGVDEEATEIAAFLVPNAYSPPLLSGQSSLPAELRDEAVAEARAQRIPEP
jgi:hypothetical protein